HGRVERDDYTIDRVFFESLPGHFVTGSLYLPKNPPKSMPGILCPHGHWPDGRFMDRGVGTPATQKEIDTGAEKLVSGARSPLQARCVQLARMGCAVFHYDMLGYADSLQFKEHRHGMGAKGFLSVDADLRLQTYFGLQIWNNVRALDFLLSLEGVDASRIGCTGASGGGTQTMILSGIDPRITAAFPCVMVSTSMQGGCTCENSHYLRINQGNIDIAALTAPRPLGLTAADDWTKELATKGLPELTNLYVLLEVADRITAHIATQFPHNYNLPSRLAMYAFFNKHFKLGLPEPIEERDFKVSSKEELTVWTAEHPAPSGDQVGMPHELSVCGWMTAQDKTQVQGLLEGGDETKIRQVVGGAWETIIGRLPPKASEVVFELGQKEERIGYTFMEGVTTCRPVSEQVPATFLYPPNWNGTAVLWLSLNGSASILTSGKPTPAAQKLLDAGIAVACPSLYLEGATESPKAGDNLKAKPNDFREFSGYTYGYNPTLLARRVHDVMSMAVMMRNHPNKPAQRILIAGVDGAGPIAAASGMMLRDSVNGLALDLNKFAFDRLGSHWDINFVPGAVKYGGIPALIQLSAPLKVTEASGNEAVAAALIK
ncbi:MAG TPA: acetylxylan esterase, partial [Prosthecobacter sp.]|nr:acetylxylan esterase [Prosthecobacter sp.]